MGADSIHVAGWYSSAKGKSPTSGLELLTDVRSAWFGTVATASRELGLRTARPDMDNGSFGYKESVSTMVMCLSEGRYLTSRRCRIRMSLCLALVPLYRCVGFLRIIVYNILSTVSTPTVGAYERLFFCV